MVKRGIVLFDYGGVIAFSRQDPYQSQLASLLKASSLDVRHFTSEKSWQGRAYRSDEITEKQFWDEVMKTTGQQYEVVPEYKALSRLFAQAQVPNKKMLELLLEIKKTNYVGIITNIDRERSRYVTEEMKITDYVDYYFPSFEFKATKYSEKLWKDVENIITMELGIKKENYIYVDDKIQHVDMAKSLGWNTIKFENIDNLKEELKKFCISI